MKNLAFVLFALLLVGFLNAWSFNFAPSDFGSRNFNFQVPRFNSNLVFSSDWNVLIGSQNSGNLRLICPVNDDFCTGNVLFGVRRTTSDLTSFTASLILRNRAGVETVMPLGSDNLAGRLMHFRERIAFSSGQYVNWKVRVCEDSTQNCFDSRTSQAITIN